MKHFFSTHRSLIILLWLFAGGSLAVAQPRPKHRAKHPARVFVTPEAIHDDDDATIDTNWIRVHLVYPPDMLRAGRGGEASGTVTIDSSGMATINYVLGTDTTFAEAWRGAVRGVTGTRAAYMGTPYQTTIAVVVEFKARRSKKAPREYAGAMTIETYAEPIMIDDSAMGKGGDIGGMSLIEPSGSGDPEELPEPAAVLSNDRGPAHYPGPDEYVEVDYAPLYDKAELMRAVRYPEIARRDSIEGRVKVEALIDIDSSVVRTTVEYSTNVVFNDAAMDAVKRTRFIPARRGGTFVPTWIIIPIEFKLAK